MVRPFQKNLLSELLLLLGTGKKQLMDTRLVITASAVKRVKQFVRRAVLILEPFLL